MQSHFKNTIRFFFIGMVVIITTNLSAEPVIREGGFSPSAPELQESSYVVMVNLDEQRVFVYHKEKEIRRMICSSGLPENDNATPPGRFIIDESGHKRGQWFYSDTYGEGAKYWVGFIGGTYLFHSVPMDKDQHIIEEEAKRIGQPASHGCIRLSVADAQWFYETIPSGSVLYITGTTPNSSDASSAELPMYRPLTKQEVCTWLADHHQEFYQQHLLSCEAALVRMTAACIGIPDLTEEGILADFPKGLDPETAFVCNNIDQGRRGPGNTIRWNNYGTHPPVVVKQLNHYIADHHLASLYTLQEVKADDAQLKDLISTDEHFLGAIVWLVGHPERWGAHPPVNDRGMVLGEHVRFVAPKLDASGNFIVWDPENHPNQPYHVPTLAGRELFNYRIAVLLAASP